MADKSLGEMAPSYTGNRTPNDHARYTQLPSQCCTICFASLVARTYCRHLECRQLIHRAASLAQHIHGIGGLRSHKEMCGSHTSSVVTGMQNAHSFGDCPVREFVGIAVGVCGHAVDCNNTIAVPTASGPVPAAFPFCHVPPEAFLNGGGETLPATVSFHQSFRPRRVGKESLPAVRAGRGYRPSSHCQKVYNTRLVGNG
jgi:hypothetical protein